MDWQINGHKKQLELLEKALAKGTLAHAYVFAGPDGVGKKTIAKNLAYALIEGEGGRGKGIPQENYFHPDFLEIDGQEGIKIDQIRELSYKLSLKPYSAKNKVALIETADQMSDEAANALLKTLEEPKDYTYIILTTSNSQRLPKTILSRCQKVTFGPIDKPEESTEQLQVSKSFYEIFVAGKLPDRLIAAYDIADMETEEIKKMFDYWLFHLERSLRTQASKSVAGKTSQVLMARKYMDQNVNTKLLLTNLMISTQ